MPPRRTLSLRGKSAVQAVAAGQSGSVAVNNEQNRQSRQKDSWLNLLAKGLFHVGNLWRKVNGSTFAYVCFLAVFSIVVRNTQGGDDKSYLLVQSILGEVEGGFDSTNYMEYPVTGKLNFGIRDISNLDDLWEWLYPGQFIGVFFPESWYAACFFHRNVLSLVKFICQGTTAMKLMGPLTRAGSIRTIGLLEGSRCVKSEFRAAAAKCHQR
jgi:hypothetical protein